MKKIILFCAAVTAAGWMFAGEGEFGFASWNIGHFALGKRWYSTISVGDAPKKIAEYRAFLADADARVVGLCEHEPFVGTNNTFAIEKTILSDYDGKAVDSSGLGRLNALYWKNAECVKSGMVKYRKHVQNCYYRYARLKIAGREVCFVMTHMDWNTMKPGHEGDRDDQIRTLIEAFRDEPYVVIGGDFNTCVCVDGKWKDSPEEYEPFIRAGFTAAHRGELKTWPAKDPYQSVDNIFVRGFDMSDVRVLIDPSLSDHALIRCKLAFK
jgi:hypothetical protein